MFYGTLPKLNEQLTLCVFVANSGSQCFTTNYGCHRNNLTSNKKRKCSLVQFLQSILHSLNHWSEKNEDKQLN